MYDVFSGQKPHRVSEISTCMDRTNLSLPISHVDTQQRKRFPWKTCANDVIWGKKKKKKKGSVPPCQNQQLQFCSSTVGGHSETTVRKRVVEVLLHVLLLAELLSQIHFILAALPLQREHVVCETLFSLTWDIITGPPSVAPAAMDVCGPARVCVCVCEMTSQPSRATPCNTTAVTEG